MRDDELAKGPTAVPSGELTGIRRGGEAARLEPGARAGDYEIVRRIGGGAMGDVYEGVHREIGKRVAIKVIKHVLADSQEAVERFKREARAVNRIEHPNVLDVFAFGNLDDGRLYLAMDLLEGESLRSRLSRYGELDLDTFLEVFEPLCAAVAGAHAKGVVHRDLKPDNVFLSRTASGAERIVVLDFGIAKVLTDAASETGRGTLTGQGVWIGTPAYMAPEQWSSDGASARSDIYALGAMAYEALTGNVPYVADSVPAIMEKHFHAEVPSLSTGEQRAPLPSELDAVVRRAMAKKPKDRFADAAELWTALEQAARGKIAPAPEARTSRPLASQSHASDDRDRPAALAATHGGDVDRRGVAPIAIAVAAGLVAVAVGGVWWIQRDDGAAPSQPERRATDTLPAIDLESDPRGAIVEIDGVEIGVTPTQHASYVVGDDLEVRMSKPGYLAAVSRVTAGSEPSVRLTLARVDGFAGTWQLPNGQLRRFERDGDRVIGWKRDAAEGDDGSVLGYFEFERDKDGWIAFGRALLVIDEHNPQHPSCRRELGAQYRYHPATDVMQQRLEKDRIVFENGMCTALERRWEEPQPVKRVSGAEQAGEWTVSRAGGAAPIQRQPQNEAEPLDDEPQLESKPKPKQKSRAKPARSSSAQRNADKKRPPPVQNDEPAQTEDDGSNIDPPQSNIANPAPNQPAEPITPQQKK